MFFSLFFALLNSLGMLSMPAMDSLPQPVITDSIVVVEQDGVQTINVLDELGQASGVMITDDGDVFSFGPRACDPVLLEEGTDYTVLFEAGYVGRADDGMEALYAPDC